MAGSRTQARNEDALRWFERAMEVDPSSLSANGLGVTYLDLERFEDAEDVLHAYASEDEDLEEVYLAAAAALLAIEPRIELDEDVLARIVEAGMAPRSVAMAEELGWYGQGHRTPGRYSHSDGAFVLIGRGITAVRSWCWMNDPFSLPNRTTSWFCAWSYYHLRRYVEAEQMFSAVAATGYRDAAAGLAAARGSLAAQNR